MVAAQRFHQRAYQRCLAGTGISFEEKEAVRILGKEEIGERLEGQKLVFRRFIGEIFPNLPAYMTIYHFLRINFRSKDSVLNILS